MGIMLSSIPFIRDDVRNEVISLQTMVQEINGMQVNGRITDWKRWRERRELLEQSIIGFNTVQMNLVKYPQKIADTKELLPLYLDRNTCIQAAQKVSKGYLTDNVFITYRYRVVGFSAFFKAQENLICQYSQLRSAFMTLAYCVFENARYPVESRYVYGIPGPGGNNPYLPDSYVSLLGYPISKSNVASIGGIKRCLTEIFRAICGDGIAPITGKMAHLLVFGTCAKKSIENLIDDVFLAYVFIKQGVEWNGDVMDFGYGISRHVAWCTFRGKNKECLLLDQPCHASVDCAFYREDSAKKARLK